MKKSTLILFEKSVITNTLSVKGGTDSPPPPPPPEEEIIVTDVDQG